MIFALLVLALTQVPSEPRTPQAPLQSPVRDARPTPTGSGSIRGRVVAADTGEPIRDCRVILLAGDVKEAHPQPASARTREDGRFEFHQLAAGTYRLVAAPVMDVLDTSRRRTAGAIPSAANPNGDFQAVTPGYFEVMRLSLARGRFLTTVDREDAPLAVVINETIADRYWSGQEPIGQRFRMGTGDTPWLTIVGIVRAVRHNAAVEAPRAEMYLAHAQLPRSIGGASRSLTLVLRTSSDPLASAGALRETVRALDAIFHSPAFGAWNR